MEIKATYGSDTTRVSWLMYGVHNGVHKKNKVELDEGSTISRVMEKNKAKMDSCRIKLTRDIMPGKREISGALLFYGKLPSDLSLVKADTDSKKNKFCEKKIDPNLAPTTLTKYPILEYNEKQFKKWEKEFGQDCYDYPLVMHPKSYLTIQLIKKLNKEFGQDEEFKVLYYGSDDCTNLFSSCLYLHKKLGFYPKIDVVRALMGHDEHIPTLLELCPILKSHINIIALDHHLDSPHQQEEFGSYDLIIDTYTWPWHVSDEEAFASVLTKHKSRLKRNDKKVVGRLLLVVPVDVTKEPFDGSYELINWKLVYEKLTKQMETENATTHPGINCHGWIYPPESSSSVVTSSKTDDGIATNWQDFDNLIRRVAKGRGPMRPIPTTVTKIISEWLDDFMPQRILLVRGPTGWGKTSCVGDSLFPKYPNNETIHIQITSALQILEVANNFRGKDREGSLIKYLLVDELQNFEGDNIDKLVEELIQLSKVSKLILVGREEGKGSDTYSLLEKHEDDVLSVDIHKRLLPEDFNNIFNGIIDDYDDIEIEENQKENILSMMRRNSFSPQDLKREMALYRAEGSGMLTLDSDRILANDNPIERIANLFLGSSEVERIIRGE